MLDLTEAIAGMETGNWIEPAPTPGDWTEERLRSFLDAHGLKYDRRQNGKYDLAVCPLCQHNEGNPSVWILTGRPVYKCHRDKHCGGKTFADVEAKFDLPKLLRISAAELVKRCLRPRKSVVQNLVRHGDVVNIIGGPKARKSFLVMQLALCVASGSPFLAWETVPGRMLLIDNELRGDDLSRRLMAMAQAMRLDWDKVSQNIDIMALRGKLADLTNIQAELCSLPPDTYSLVVLDALYKALPANVDENSNSNITQMYVLLDSAAEAHNCATVVVHHTSKGAQQQKSVSDMGSGAGAQSRSADVHIVLREHEDKDTVVLQAIVRSQRPVEPTCLAFNYPLWELAPDKSPHKVSLPNKKPTPTVEEFLETIPAQPTPKTAALAIAKGRLNVSKDGLNVLLQHCIQEGHVLITVPKNKNLPHMLHRVKK